MTHYARGSYAVKVTTQPVKSLTAVTWGWPRVVGTRDSGIVASLEGFRVCQAAGGSDGKSSGPLAAMYGFDRSVVVSHL